MHINLIINRREEQQKGWATNSKVKKLWLFPNKNKHDTQVKSGKTGRIVNILRRGREREGERGGEVKREREREWGRGETKLVGIYECFIKRPGD